MRTARPQLVLVRQLDPMGTGSARLLCRSARSPFCQQRFGTGELQFYFCDGQIGSLCLEHLYRRLKRRHGLLQVHRPTFLANREEHGPEMTLGLRPSQRHTLARPFLLCSAERRHRRPKRFPVPLSCTPKLKRKTKSPLSFAHKSGARFRESLARAEWNAPTASSNHRLSPLRRPSSVSTRPSWICVVK